MTILNRVHLLVSLHFLVLYGDRVVMALCNYSGLIAPRLTLYKVWNHLTQYVFAFWIVPAARPHTVRLVRRLQY